MGVPLGLDLNLDPQVSVVARTVFAEQRLVSQLHPFLEMSGTHALDTSQLDHFSTLHVGLPLKSVQKLQLVQRAAARLLTRAGYREHTMPLLKQLHWLPVYFPGTIQSAGYHK